MIGKLLGHILEAQSLPREAQEAPKTSQNGSQNVKKAMFKNKAFSYSIFSWILLFFFNVFLDVFLKPKIVKMIKNSFCQNLKNSDFP